MTSREYHDALRHNTQLRLLCLLALAGCAYGIWQGQLPWLGLLAAVSLTLCFHGLETVRTRIEKTYGDRRGRYEPLTRSSD